jgi:hypothetical protein
MLTTIPPKPSIIGLLFILIMMHNSQSINYLKSVSRPNTVVNGEIFLVVGQPLVGQRHIIVETPESRTETHHTL